MNIKYQFRGSDTFQERIGALAKKRKTSNVEILRIAVDIGLTNLEVGRHIDLSRQLTMLEMTGLAVDLILKKIAPEVAEEVPGLVLHNLEKYHGKL